MSETERQAGKVHQERGGGARGTGGVAGTDGPGASAGRRGALDALAHVDLFGGLDTAQLSRLVSIGVEANYERGDKIFEEAEIGDRLYLILDGAVRISRFVPRMGEETLAVLWPGAYFGEMSLIDDEVRSAAAIAHESCRLFVIARRDLHDLMFVDRDLAYDFLWKMVRTLSRRLRTTSDRTTFLAFTNKF